MKSKNMLIASGIGLGLTLALLWLLSGSSAPVTAASALNRVERPIEHPLADATSIHYVAITGTDSGDCSTPANACLTVQYAVDQADDGDEIRVAAGIYTGVLSHSAPSGYCCSSVVTQVVYLTKTVAIRGGYTTTNWLIPNPDSNPTILDAEQQGRVIFISGDISPTIENVSITGGDATGLQGGVFALDAGGGVYINEADGATIRNNRMFNNTARAGGGVYLLHSGATLEGNTVVSNTGSGLWVDNTFDATATLVGNIIVANNGSGVFLGFDGDVILINNVVANNQGHGVCIMGPDVQLLHTTIAQNSNAGVYVAGDWYLGYSTVFLTNTILVSHTVGITVAVDNVASLNSTLWYANADGDWGGEGTVNHTNDYSGAPSFIAPEADDYHIGSDSAAIDRGIDARVTVDVDGESRPRTGPDIGADEFPIALGIAKEASHDPVQSGSQLTYTIFVTNTGVVTLTTTVTDILPNHVTTMQPLIWSPLTITSGNLWTATVVVTVEIGYVGPLTNVVSVTTEEGATGIYTQTSTAVAVTYNQAPYVPSNPIPADGATDIPITQTLRWQGGDPDSDLVTYTVAFGTSDPPPVVATITMTNYAPILITDTTYYWAITSSDGISTSLGPVWRFTTVGFKYVYLPLVLKNF